MKYKVGAKVKVRGDIEANMYCCGCLVTISMAKCAGKTCTILEAYEHFKCYRLAEDDSRSLWEEALFEDPAEEPGRREMTAKEVLGWLQKYNGTPVMKKAFGYHFSGPVVESYPFDYIIQTIEECEATRKGLEEGFEFCITNSEDNPPDEKSEWVSGTLWYRERAKYEDGHVEHGGTKPLVLYDQRWMR